MHLDAAGVRAVDAEDRARHLAAPGADEAGERDDLAARTSNETSVKTPSRVRRSTLSTVAPTLGDLTFGKSASMSRPTIAWIERLRASSRRSARSCTWRPSRITVTRWQSAKTSSSRWEMKSTAAPCGAQRLDDAGTGARPRSA